MFNKIIDRPVLATVISIILVILGILGLSRLPVTRFPDIAPPTVAVSGSYPGGNSETVIRSVVTPLEEIINGVEGMDYIRSNASNDGSFSITIVFKQGVDPDQAAVNVQNRVAQATPQLPTEVTRIGVTTSKQQNSMIMIFNLFSEDNKKFDELFLQNYANINLIPEVKRIPGVGQAQVFGAKDYNMRIWLDPQKMASNGLIPQDVSAALADQSLEAAPGKLGQESSAAMEYVIRYRGKKNMPEQYGNIIVKTRTEDGSVIRLRDVARVEFGAIAYGSDNKMNGKDAVTIAIIQTSGSNANEVETGIRDVLTKMSTSFPKGIKYQMVQSTKEKLDEATSQVKSTLIEAFVLVFIVVYLFLQDFRSTLIPAIAVPVAIIGTFFFLMLLGFTINVLTLFALILAIGIVVDDAIVVVEAVHHKMETEHLPAKKATTSAMSEITGAIISITLVMCAVFLPIGFMQGPSGIFYRQFAYTLVIAILISAVNALTLSPALCALFLKENHKDAEGKKKGFGARFFTAFEAGFGQLTGRYSTGLQFLIKHKWISGGLITLTLALGIWLLTSTQKSFVPMEDDAFITYSVSMPAGTALDRTTAVVKEVDNRLRKIEAIESNTAISGFNILSNAASPAYAMGFIKLKPKKERGEEKDIDNIMGLVSAELAQIQEGTVSAFRSAPVEGYGSIGGAELVLQDRKGRSLAEFSKVADDVIASIGKLPEIESAFTTFRADYPQFELEVEEDKTKQLGLGVRDLLTTIQYYYAGDQSADFTRFGKFYRVTVKADGVFRMDESSFNDIFARNSQGEMVPVKNLVKLKRVYGPEAVNRYNLYNAITINATNKPGVSNGLVMEKMEKLLKEKLPSDVSYEWSGLSREEQRSGSQTLIIFSLSILFVYFLLSAQYESYILPLSVMLSIPTGLLGVFLGIKAVGLDNNIYVQVGMIMLIGLVAKNAILIVEFALQRRRSGESITKAALEAARVRLRPILMTSLAFIVGMIPLMASSGGTAVGNRSISVGAAAGMLTGVVLGVFVVPVLFILFQSIQEKISSKNQPELSGAHTEQQ